MALSSTSGTSSSSSRTIAITHYNDTNAKLANIYTVPEGKVFVGRVFVNSGTYGYGRINDMNEEMYFSGSSSVEGSGFLELTLHAGDVYKSSNQNYAYHTIVGVESDA